MKERPILMSGPMVVATMREIDPKWQTRRIAKEPIWVELLQMVRGEIPIGPISVAKPGLHIAYLNPLGAVSVKDCNDELLGVKPGEFRFLCPYGEVGDRLWVRETWAYGCPEDVPDKIAVYRADLDGEGRFQERLAARGSISYGYNRWRPSIHMPRWASRITLEITKVRVERVQQITDENAIAEGVPRENHAETGYYGPRTHFKHLWDSINGKRDGGKYAWEKNPWVWVLEFKRI